MAAVATLPKVEELVLDHSIRLAGIADKCVFKHKKSGRRFLFKVGQYDSKRWGNNTPAEWASYRVAKAIGAAIPETMKATLPYAGRNRRGLLYEFIDGAKTIGKGWDEFQGIDMWSRPVAREMVKQMVLDYLVADSDRHAENFITDGKRVWGIDHGFAFRADGWQSPTERYTRLGGGVYHRLLDPEPERVDEEPAAVRFLRSVRPSDFSKVFDTLDAIPDTKYLRMLGKAADGEALTRKSQARIGFGELMVSVIGQCVGGVPKVWVNWFNNGGIF